MPDGLKISEQIFLLVSLSRKQLETLQQIQQVLGLQVLEDAASKLLADALFLRETKIDA